MPDVAFVAGGITMARDPRYSSQDDPYESRYASYDEQFADPVDLDEFGSQLRSYNSGRSVATREEFLPDDSVPLFLSGSEEASRTPRFGSARKNGSSRLVKTAALAIAATVAAFVAVAVKNPFTVFANATASLIGISDVRSAPVPPPVQPTVSARATSPAATQPPSRDEIAVALRTARQSVPPAEPAAPVAPVAAAPVAAAPVAAVAPMAAVAPVIAAAPAVAPAPPVASAPVRSLGADELATLMTRAKALLAAGDISPARLLLERAAEAQEANAALMLAQTYDPAVMGAQDMRNINTDPALARSWYQRAAQLGSADAQRRLAQLQ
jgi:hypothetical protein